MTSYVKMHPGGEAILNSVGGDATIAFHKQAAHRVVKTFIENTLKTYYVGTLLPQKRKLFDREKGENNLPICKSNK